MLFYLSVLGKPGPLLIVVEIIRNIFLIKIMDMHTAYPYINTDIIHFYYVPHPVYIIKFRIEYKLIKKYGQQYVMCTVLVK